MSAKGTSVSKFLWNNVYLNLHNIPWDHPTYFERCRQFLENVGFPVEGEKKRILDFGCGTGGFTEYFECKRHEVFGVDISDIAIQTAKIHHPTGRFYSFDDLSDLRGQIPLIFNTVFCWGVFHHLPPLEWERYIDFFLDILDDGGGLLIGGWDEKNIDFQNPEKRRRSQFTNSDTWAINDLEHLLVPSFNVYKSDVFVMHEAYTDLNRDFRYIIAKKK